jgi:hypothetical protein
VARLAAPIAKMIVATAASRIAIMFVTPLALTIVRVRAPVVTAAPHVPAAVYWAVAGEIAQLAAFFLVMVAAAAAVRMALSIAVLAMALAVQRQR